MSDHIQNSPNNDESDVKFITLCCRYLDGVLSDEELAGFSELLSNSDKARASFVRHMMQEVHLNELLSNVHDLAGESQAKQLIDLEAQDECSLNVVSEHQTTPSSQLAPTINGDIVSPESVIPPAISSESSALNTANTFPLRGFMTGMSVFIGLIALVLWSQFGNHDNPEPLADKAQHENSNTGQFEVRSLHVDSGTTKFSLANIGYVVAEGPADFEMLGPKLMRVKNGRIMVHVTEESGRGFKVVGNKIEATDWGTKFVMDVSKDRDEKLAVFEGEVEYHALQDKQDDASTHSNRLVQGEGVSVNDSGEVERLVSIVTGKKATFQSADDNEMSDHKLNSPVIHNVTDNLRSAETKKFYEIVPGGFCEDAMAYVDRSHQWNGKTESGLPRYLIGADYVKTFNDDKMNRDVNITVTLNCPAKLYVFYDTRLVPRGWLKAAFRKTGDVIALDMGPVSEKSEHVLGVGPGVALDHSFDVWERISTEPGTVILGYNNRVSEWSGMYGIAAVALDTSKPKEK